MSGSIRIGFVELWSGNRRVPSLERAKKLIGYEPTRTLDDILQDVIAYEQASSAKRG